MNPVVIGIGGVSYSAKKIINVTLVTMTVILLLPVLAVASMGTSAISFLAHSASAKDAETQGFYLGGAVDGDTYAWGNCTYWAYAMRLWAGNPIGQWWGNANTWDDSARKEEYIIDRIPAVGAIFQTDEGQWGHVAYVVNVNPLTGDWTISEMNAPHLNVVSTRTFSKESAAYYTFIHDRKGATIWTSQPISNPLPSTGN